MGFTLGKRTQIDNMSRPEPGIDNTAPGTPGKRTLTDQLAGQVKAQEHQICDDPNSGCFLDPATRDRLDRDITANIIGAMSAWSNALLNKRMDILAKHEEGWNTLWKIAGVIAMAAIGDGVGFAVDWLAESAETINAMRVAGPIVNREETVHTLFDFAGEQVLDKVKDKVNESASETGHAQADFLSTQIDGPHQWGTGLMKAFPKRLDDYGRLLLLGLTSEKVMTAAAFTRKINELLARWQEQVGAIGERVGALRDTTAAWVYPRGGGKPKLAIVVASFLDGGLGQKDEWMAEAFVRWIEPDMAPYAIDKLNESKMSVRGPINLGNLQSAPTDPETLSWDRGGEATDPMWPDFGKQRRNS